VKSTCLTLLIAVACCTVSAVADEPVRKTIWQGSLHLGDNPEQYSNLPTAGITMQVPCKLDQAKKGKLIVVTRDIQTLLGEGHYAELIAHFEEQGGDSPASESVVETFRLKGNSTNADIEHTFDFDPAKGLMAPAAYYSIRIKLDTFIKFGLWDDFVLKQIDVQQQ
jgi:hypothetical protein